MQVAYNMEKRDGAWVVKKTQAAGGTIEHPAPGANPHQSQNVHSGGLPNINDILNPTGASAPGALPPGHPPLKSQTGAQAQASPEKPR